MDLFLILSIFLNFVFCLTLVFLLKKFISLRKHLENMKQKQAFWEEAFYQLEFPVFIINEKKEILWQNRTSLNKFGYLKGGKIDSVLKEIQNYPWEMKSFLLSKEFEIYILIDKSEEELFKKSYTLALSYLSHELKTPFTIMKGYAEKLETEILDSNLYFHLHQYFIPFKNALERVEKLTSKLFTSLEYLVKELPLKEKMFDLKVALEEIIFWIKPLCEDKNLNLEVDVPQNLLIKGDQDLIMQALLNPIENAVKFSPQNGKIIIKAYVRENQRINIFIRDEGPGVHPEDLPFLGMPFFKSSAEKGLGFGLFITKKIIEAHQGKISFNLPPQGGLEVLIEIPYA